MANTLRTTSLLCAALALAGCAADRPAPSRPPVVEPDPAPECPKDGGPLSCAGQEDAARR